MSCDAFDSVRHSTLFSKYAELDLPDFIYSVSQKIPPGNFLAFFPKRLGIFVQILHACYMFLSTLDYKFLFN